MRHSYSLPAFVTRGLLFTFISEFNNAPTRNNIFMEANLDEERDRSAVGSMVQKIVFFCFLLNAAWLTFPADTDKSMRVCRTLCAWVSVSVVRQEKERSWVGVGGCRKINEIIDVTCQI